jgi:TatA/E family protein of Tat protein translocase
MFNIGPLELLAILVVALLVFGPEKLPEMGKQVGKAMREFKKFQASMQDNVRDIVEPITGPIMPGNNPLSPSNIFGGGPPPTNISGGPLPTENNVPRSATIQNPETPDGEAAPAPGTFGHYAPVEPTAPAAGPPPAPAVGTPPANGSEAAAPPSAGGTAPAGGASPEPDQR